MSLFHLESSGVYEKAFFSPDSLVKRPSVSKNYRIQMTGRLSGEEKIFQVVFERGGQHFKTLYWTGTIEEAQDLARKIALNLRADAFLIFDITGGAEACSEERASAAPYNKR